MRRSRQMGFSLTIFFAPFLLCVCAKAGPRSYEMLPMDASRPHVLGEGVISTPGDESGGVFSPDGKDFFFVRTNPTTTFPRLGLLCVTHWRERKWSPPEVVSFSGKYLDMLPRLSPDGKTMYFASSRPLPDSNVRSLHVWKVERSGEDWGEPQPAPAPINDPPQRWNWGASVTSDGTMYFASDREKPGRPQIYRAALANGRYQQPEKLSREINSEFNEFDPYVSADESILLFVSAGEGIPPFRHREDVLYTGGFPYARGDIYMSRRVNGKWTKAVHLGKGVNSVADESSPALTPDAKFLIFSSERSPFVIPMQHRIAMAEFEQFLHSTMNGHGNIYTMPFAAFTGGKGSAK